MYLDKLKPFYDHGECVYTNNKFHRQTAKYSTADESPI